MIEPCILARLAADSTLKPLLVTGTGSKRETAIYPVNLPEGKAPPAITYTVVSEIEDKDLDGPTGIFHVRLQLECWAASYGAARSLARAVKASLDDFAGALPGPDYTLDVALLELDDADGPHVDSLKRAFYTRQDFLCHFTA